MTAGLRRGALVALAIGVLAILPTVLGDFYVNLIAQTFVAVIFAASLNLLVGYGGLTSLGHAAFQGFAAYTSAYLGLQFGLGHALAAPVSLLGTTALAAFFGVIALRATGLGFLMLTLALSQVLWGLAFRMVRITNGDNGLSGLTRPSPFGLSLDTAPAFYWFALVVMVVALAAIAIYVDSALGAALTGTRDQPRRMSALGHNVWLIRWITFVFAGFWAGVSGLLYVYYHVFIHPSALSITTSAEGLLSVIAGGSGTMTGPIVGAALLMFLKNYASSYVERWNMLLGFVFLVIVLVVPDGIVPGMRRLWRRMSRGPETAARRPGAEPAGP